MTNNATPRSQAWVIKQKSRAMLRIPPEELLVVEITEVSKKYKLWPLLLAAP